MINLAGLTVSSRALADSCQDEEQTAVASLGANGSVGVYFNNSVNGGDIRMDIYDGTGVLIANDRAVNDGGLLAAAQTDPYVAANAAGDRIAVVWTDSGLNLGDIRCRVFDNTGCVSAWNKDPVTGVIGI